MRQTVIQMKKEKKKSWAGLSWGFGAIAVKITLGISELGTDAKARFRRVSFLSAYVYRQVGNALDYSTFTMVNELLPMISRRTYFVFLTIQQLRSTLQRPDLSNTLWCLSYLHWGIGLRAGRLWN